ncbi:MAG: hypothetical protein NZV14_06600 [Bryobacteraceae bacterium]|nr:hypothetical protein [Bryobacteraceae bacterium]MDW8377813.1 hypothetical protein [Bryobacterales bacterium]
MLWLLNFILTAALALRMLQLRLHIWFPFFNAFLGLILLRDVALVSAVHEARLYSWIWVSTEVLVLILLTLSTLEIYSRLLDGYPGIQSLGRWVTLGGLTLGIVMTFLTAGVGLDFESPQFVLTLVLTADRGVYLGLCSVILLMSIFLLWYPVPTPRNFVVHSLLFAIYFLSKAFLIFVRTTRGNSIYAVVSNLHLVFGVVCLCAWLLLLRRESEDPQVTFGRHWNPDEETTLLRQLRAINASLFRLSRD